MGRMSELHAMIQEGKEAERIFDVIKSQNQQHLPVETLIQNELRGSAAELRTIAATLLSMPDYVQDQLADEINGITRAADAMDAYQPEQV